MLLYNVYTYCTREELNHATAFVSLVAHVLEFNILILKGLNQKMNGYEMF